jgi:autotransporter passenger strand-loop-strand repeat protein
LSTRRHCRSRRGRAGNERSGHGQGGEEKAGVMQDYQVSSATSSGITLHDGDTMEVRAGGTVISTTAFGGPDFTTIDVENGGVANSTVLTGAIAEEFVEPGGADNDATVNNGTQLEIEGNASKGPGTGTGATINSGGQLLVDAFGSANTATINKGGNETVDGTDNNATLSGGRQFVQLGNTPGVANATTILSGGLQQVTGVANAAQILGGAQESFPPASPTTRPSTVAACRKSTPAVSQTGPQCSRAARWRSSATARLSVSRSTTAAT